MNWEKKFKEEMRMEKVLGGMKAKRERCQRDSKEFKEFGKNVSRVVSLLTKIMSGDEAIIYIQTSNSLFSALTPLECLWRNGEDTVSSIEDMVKRTIHGMVS